MSNLAGLYKIDLDVISEEIFDVGASIIEAKDYISNAEEFYKVNFEEDLWAIYHDLYGLHYHFDFGPISKYKFNFDFKNVLKCWLVDLTRDKKLTTVTRYFADLMKFINKTNGLQDELLQVFIDGLRNNAEMKESYKTQLVTSILHFTSYYNNDDFLDPSFLIELVQYKETLKKEDSESRTLPKSSDVMVFSYYVQEYFEKQVDMDSTEYLRYFPIYLWWEITNKIPMRISEFCRIKRKDFPEIVGNKIYLKLPREKFTKKGVQIVDKIIITEILAEKIQDYIDRTDVLGESETLISYLAQHHTNKNQSTKQHSVKRYNRGRFYHLLNEFYDKIINEKFNVSSTPSRIAEVDFSKQYDIERRIRPNDTRHFAFMSLTMQGYHPVEIARLGGHSTLDMQYGYQYHNDFWVDSEIEKLINNFSFATDIKKNKLLESSENISLINRIQFNAIYAPPTNPEFLMPCKYGFCTDEKQRCVTETCFECKHWRINVEEWENVSYEIEKIIMNKRQKINELHSFLANLHKTILTNKYTEIDYQYSNQLIETTNKIKAEITAIVQLMIKLKR